jgi:hypothetical protein
MTQQILSRIAFPILLARPFAMLLHLVIADCPQSF